MGIAVNRKKAHSTGGIPLAGEFLPQVAPRELKAGPVRRSMIFTTD
jgi:hypothetical protein